MKRTPFPAIVIIAVLFAVLGGMGAGQVHGESAERDRVFRFQRI